MGTSVAGGPASPVKEALRAAVSRLGYGLVSTKTRSPGRLDALSYLAHLRELFSELGTDCVLDVGGNRGQFAQLLRKEVGYQGRIVSFEPVTGAYEAMVLQLTGDRAWSGRQVALGSEPGTEQIHVFSQDNFSSFLTPSAYGTRRFSPLAERGSAEHVTVRRLDEEWAEATAGCTSTFVKLDTQGRDLDVLAGASSILDQIQGLLTEIPAEQIYTGMVSFTRTVERLQAEGFRLLGFWPETRQPDLGVIEFNCLLRR